MQLVGQKVALIMVLGVLGLTQFTENVRTVQVIGLFVSGVVVGTAWTRIVAVLTTKRNNDKRNTSDSWIF